MNGLHLQRELRRTALLAVLLIAIALAAAFAIQKLQTRSAEQFRLGIVAHDTGLEAFAVNILAWQAVTAADPTLTPEAVVSLDADVALAQLDALMEEYRENVEAAPRNVRITHIRFLALSTHVTQLLRAGRPSEAFAILQYSPPELSTLAREAHADADAYQARAERVSSYTTRASLGILAVTLAGIGLVIVLYWSSRRRTDVAIVEREALRNSEARVRALIQNSTTIITVLDAEGVIRHQSGMIEATLGFSPTDLLHAPFLDMVHPDEQPLIGGILAEAKTRFGVNQTAECQLRTSSGSWIQTEIVVQNLLNDPHVRGIVVTARDISERKTLEHELARQATFDPLTGLPNRLLFNDRLRHALERGMRSDIQRCHIMLFLDIDDFKTINDSLGHLVGDEVLVAVAERLRQSPRSRDTVARFGGDEFAILLENVEEPVATEVCERILNSFRSPFEIQGRSIQVSMSIGVVIAAREGLEAEDLLRDADTAMYMAKARGKGRYEFFTKAMHAAVVDRLDLEADMRVGLRDGQFAVYYQPVIDFTSGKIVGVEALVRWAHPERGFLQPSSFIAVAEESGLIMPLGALVLRQACKEVRSWQLQYPSQPPLSVAVNISGKQLMHQELVSEVTRALKESDLPSQSLVLEITETVLAQNTASTIRRLEALRELGVRLAIDDFGTGYSSLSYLQQFPIDIIKIDKSFVDSIERKNGTEVSDAIVSLAQALHLKTVAEGVERIDQVMHLESIGCDLWQGYYFAEPLSREAIESLLADPQQIMPGRDADQTRMAS